MRDFRFPFEVAMPFKKKTDVQKLPEEMPLPDLLTKMLVDKGCTVNREGAEAIAAYFVSTCLQIIEQSQADLRKIRSDIEAERQRW